MARTAGTSQPSRRIRRNRLNLLLIAAVCVVAAATAAPACATVRHDDRELTLIRRNALGPAVGDGRRWLAWGSAPGLFTTKWVQLNRPDRLSEPGCTPPADLAFGRLLTSCPSADGRSLVPRVIDLQSGHVTEPAPDAVQDDSFGEIGRYWLIGSHQSSDPHVDPTAAYLNLRDGHASHIDGVRDIDTTGLDRLRADTPCDRPHGPNPRNQLRFGRNRTTPLRLVSCRTGRASVVSSCPRGCHALGPGLDPDVAIWLEGRRTLRALRTADHRRYAWRLPRDATLGPPFPRLAQAHGHILISLPTSHPDTTITWSIYATDVPPRPAHKTR